MNKKELIEIIEGCVINSQVLTEERVCFDELRKELNEELPEQLILSGVIQRSELLLFDEYIYSNESQHDRDRGGVVDRYLAKK